MFAVIMYYIKGTKIFKCTKNLYAKNKNDVIPACICYHFSRISSSSGQYIFSTCTVTVVSGGLSVSFLKRNVLKNNEYMVAPLSYFFWRSVERYFHSILSKTV